MSPTSWADSKWPTGPRPSPGRAPPGSERRKRAASNRVRDPWRAWSGAEEDRPPEGSGRVPKGPPYLETEPCRLGKAGPPPSPPPPHAGEGAGGGGAGAR